MKKIIAFLLSIWIMISSFIFACSFFSSHPITHSVINTAVLQTRLEDRIQDLFISSGIPFQEDYIDDLALSITEILNKEDVINEMNIYTDAFVYDIAHDQRSEVTSNLNQTFKEHLVSYADKLMDLGLPFMSSDVIKSFLSSLADIINIESLYLVVLEETKQELTPNQILALKVLSLLQSNLIFYASLGSMVIASLLLLLFRKRFTYLSIAWITSAIIVLVISYVTQPILKNLFDIEVVAQAIDDHMDKLSSFGIIYLLIGLVSLLCMFIQKNILKRKNNH